MNFLRRLVSVFRRRTDDKKSAIETTSDEAFCEDGFMGTGQDTINDIPSYNSYESPAQFYTLPDEMLILMDPNPTIGEDTSLLETSEVLPSSSQTSHGINSFDTFPPLEEVSISKSLDDKSWSFPSQSDSFEVVFKVNHHVYQVTTEKDDEGENSPEVTTNPENLEDGNTNSEDRDVVANNEVEHDEKEEMERSGKSTEKSEENAQNAEIVETESKEESDINKENEKSRLPSETVAESENTNKIADEDAPKNVESENTDTGDTKNDNEKQPTTDSSVNKEVEATTEETEASDKPENKTSEQAKISKNDDETMTPEKENTDTATKKDTTDQTEIPKEEEEMKENTEETIKKEIKTDSKQEDLSFETPLERKSILKQLEEDTNNADIEPKKSQDSTELNNKLEKSTKSTVRFSKEGDKTIAEEKSSEMLIRQQAEEMGKISAAITSTTSIQIKESVSKSELGSSRNLMQFDDREKETSEKESNDVEEKGKATKEKPKRKRLVDDKANYQTEMDKAFRDITDNVKNLSDEYDKLFKTKAKPEISKVTVTPLTQENEGKDAENEEKKEKGQEGEDDIEVEAEKTEAKEGKDESVALIDIKLEEDKVEDTLLTTKNIENKLASSNPSLNLIIKSEKSILLKQSIFEIEGEMPLVNEIKAEDKKQSIDSRKSGLKEKRSSKRKSKGKKREKSRESSRKTADQPESIADVEGADRASDIYSIDQLDDEELEFQFQATLRPVDARSLDNYSEQRASRASGRESTRQSFIQDKSSMSLGTVNDSDLSLVTTDYKIVKKVRLKTFQIKPLIMSIPINIKGARSQYVDLRRGELIRMKIVKMCTLEVGRTVIEDQRQGKFIQILLYTIKKILRFGPKNKLINLRYHEFILLLLFHEANIASQIKLLQVLITMGTAYGTIILFLQVIFLDGPMMMFIMTMTVYSRLMYLGFLKSIPMLKGLGYTMFALFILIESISTVYIELAIQYCFYIFSHIELWLSCVNEVENFKDHECIPYPTNVTHNLNCKKGDDSLEGYAFFSTQFMFRYNDMSLYFNVDTIYEILVAINAKIMHWFIIFSAGIAGFYRMRKILVNSQICLAILASMFCGHSMTLRNEVSASYYDWSKIENLMNINVTLRTIMAATKFEMIPYLVWVSTMAPSGIDPEACVALIIVIKLIWILLTSLSLQVQIYGLIDTYKIHPPCLFLDGYDAIFLLVPNFSAPTAFTPLKTFCWTLMLISVMLIKECYSIQLIIDTIGQYFPKVRSAHLLFTLSICLLMLGVQSLHYNQRMYELMNDIYEKQITSCVIIAFCLFVIGLNFSYTWMRFSDDYLFTYGTRPQKFWKIWLNVMSYICFLLFLVVFFLECYRSMINENLNGSILLVIILIVTTVAWMQRLLCMNLFHRTLYKTVLPARDWLPHNKKLAQVRRYYIYTRDQRVKYSALSCNHFCLRVCKDYKPIVTRQEVIKRRKMDDGHVSTIPKSKRLSGYVNIERRIEGHEYLEDKWGLDKKLEKEIKQAIRLKAGNLPGIINITPN